MRILHVFILISVLYFQKAKAVDFTANSTINSIGYYINVGTVTGPPLVKYTSTVVFKKTTDLNWREALTPVKQKINNVDLIIGSVLQLDAGTAYHIKVKIYDSIGNIFRDSITKTYSTQPEPIIPIVTDTLWVSPNGSGNLFSRAHPGRFEDLFIRYREDCNINTYENVNNGNIYKVKCGSVIICKGGLYNVGNLLYQSFRVPCSDLNKPVIIQSASGEQAIFDGSDTAQSIINPVWDVFGNPADHIYRTSQPLPQHDAFSTLFRYDGVRLFPYAALYNSQVTPLNGNYRDVLNNCADFYGSGFYRSTDNYYYIKLANNEDPRVTQKKVTVSRFFNLLEIQAMGGPNVRFIFKNLTIKNYGKAKITYNRSWIQTGFWPWEGFDCYSPNNGLSSDGGSSALYLRDCKNLLIDSCTFEYNTTSIYAEITNAGAGDNAIIQGCTFTDNSGLWNHAAYKNSDLVQTGDIGSQTNNGLLDNGKFGRNLQTAAIGINYSTASLKNIIVRNNIFEGLVATFGAKADNNNPNPAYDIDFNNNTINNCYNAMGVAEISCNARAWNNKLSNISVGYSTISSHVYPNIGPVYIFRNIFGKMRERNTLLTYPNMFNTSLYIFYSNGCVVNQNRAKNWSTCLKMNSGHQTDMNTLDVFFIHNTVIAEDSFARCFLFANRNWRSLTSINNIYYAKNIAIEFDGTASNNNYPFISKKDCYYSAVGKLGWISHEHGLLRGAGSQPCEFISNADSIQKILQRVTLNYNTNILSITQPYKQAPQFIDYANSNYQIIAGELVDTGIRVPNISDVLGLNYFCIAPEIGAIENPDCPEVLPVELIKLTAKPINNKYIQVDWATASERNIQHFEVLRSIDGINFEWITSVNAVGFSNSIKKYSINDLNVMDPTLYYYKIKSIDFDNTFQESNIVTARLKPFYDFKINAIYPNPTNNILNFDILSDNEEYITIRVFDDIGNIIVVESKKIRTGNNTININTKSWTSGLYIISVQTPTGKQMIYKISKM